MDAAADAAGAAACGCTASAAQGAGRGGSCPTAARRATRSIRDRGALHLPPPAAPALLTRTSYSLHSSCSGGTSFAMSQEMKSEEVSGEIASGTAASGDTASGWTASGEIAKLPYSPEASSSSASASSGSKPKRFSVYSHIEGIQEIGQLRGLRSGRRRSRFRGTRRNAVAQKYAEVHEALEPIFQKETLRLKDAQTLVAAAIEHFANTVTSLADQLEMQENEIACRGSEAYLTSVIV